VIFFKIFFWNLELQTLRVNFGVCHFGRTFSEPRYELTVFWFKVMRFYVFAPRIVRHLYNINRPNANFLNNILIFYVFYMF